MPTLRPFLLLPFLMLAACGGGEKPADGTSGGLVIGGEEAVVTSMYQMPTPNELFGLVRQMAGDGHRRLMNPSTNVDRYVSLRARAVNFGVYATDLVYASSFKLNVDVARYYLTSKKLASSLGLDAAFTDADFVRLESNLARGDSLEIISNEAYQRAYERMQQEDMGPVLHLVLAGGWMESMHLVVRQIEAFGGGEALMARVAEQKVTLDHLLGMMEATRDQPDVAAVYTDLAAVRAIYDQLEVKRSAHQGASPSGRMVLGEDVTIELTQAKYQELAQAIDRLRAEWTKPEGDTTNS
ncbi:MAG: hypothetical protein IPK70_06375 [Flavobacteriales bacterium]|jgi:hypothetical protein|nr:hypothetical protein [Flavobacteriales bacterium]